MTSEELYIVVSDETRRAIESNIERQHTVVALDKSLCNSKLVAQQVKYLQRAERKLPSFYASRCVVPPRAFEQCSSEAAANHKRMSGERVLELTCGLGVDALALSERFESVVTLEVDSVLAEVVRVNLGRMEVNNIEVVNCSAEEFVGECVRRGERFDWVYVDPDRRGDDGKKRVVFEDCSPNVLEMLDDLWRVTDRLAIKCSPLFDVDEAFRLFGGSRVESVSIGDECKEVMIYAGCDLDETEMIGATAIGVGEVWLERGERERFVMPQCVDLESYKYILIPDVSLQKSRMARRVIGEVADIWSDNGFGFMSDEGYAKFDGERHLGRVMRIDWVGDYEPKRVRKELKDRGVVAVEIFKRDSPYSSQQIFKQLKIREGGMTKIGVTKLQNRTILVILSKIEKR